MAASAFALLCFSTSAHAGGWQENEHVSSYSPSGHTVRYLEGSTPDGWSYEIFKDGTGTLSRSGSSSYDWRLNCSKDKMTDERTCFILKFSANFAVTLMPNGKPLTACVIGNDFPGRRGAIRLDKQKPIKTDEAGCVVYFKIFPQLLKAKHVTTRRYEWPDDYPKDAEGSLDGFDKAISLARYIQKNVDAIGF